MSDSYSEAYRAAGVDITAGYEAVQRMKQHIGRTHIPGVLGDIGGFGGMFAPNVAGMARPVLVSGADGVGTKLRLALLMDKHDTIGIDCVAMCVNDIICAGAKPLFFLDYIACGKNHPARIEAIVAGVAEGCVQAGCALVGGETAEHPGVMPDGDYDLAGFAVGLADQKDLLAPEMVQAGDVLIGLASSGLHSNGFSLVRRVFGIDDDAAVLARHADVLGRPLGEVLLQPTRIYVQAVQALKGKAAVHGIAHITGGGWVENIPRMLPKGLCAKVDKAAVPAQPIFGLLAKAGAISEHDLYNTFNMGLGLVLAVPPADADAALAALDAAGETAFVLGTVQAGARGVLL